MLYVCIKSTLYVAFKLTQVIKKYNIHCTGRCRPLNKGRSSTLTDSMRQEYRRAYNTTINRCNFPIFLINYPHVPIKDSVSESYENQTRFC